MNRGAKLALDIGVACLVVLGYRTVLVELVRDWIKDPNYAHGFLIPAVSAYLIFRTRDKLRLPGDTPSLLGLPGLLVAMILLVLGTAGAEVFTQRISLLVASASLVLFLYGRRHFKLVLFPIAFLLLAIPLPYVIYYDLTGPMQRLAARLAVRGLGIVGVPSLVQGNIIHLPQGSLEVAAACSGIRSLYAFLAVGALGAQSMSISMWARILVFSSTVPLSIAGNALRVWGTGVQAWLIGPQVTKGAAHEFFGIVVFCVSLGIFFLIKKVVRSLWLRDTSSLSSSWEPPPSTPVNSGRVGPPGSRFPISGKSPGNYAAGK